MSSQNLHFMEVKKRLSTLELQHNYLTSICTVLAKQVKELKDQQLNSSSQMNQNEPVQNNTRSGQNVNNSNNEFRQDLNPNDQTLFADQDEDLFREDQQDIEGLTSDFEDNLETTENRKDIYYPHAR